MGGEREEEGSCIIRSNIVIERNAFNPFNAELNPTCQMLALLGAHHIFHVRGLKSTNAFNLSNADLNPTCHLLVVLPHHILHVSGLRVKVQKRF